MNFLLALMMGIFSVHALIPHFIGGDPVKFKGLVTSGSLGYSLFFLLFVTLYSIRESHAARIVQIVAITIAGIVVISFIAPRDMGGDLLFVLASVLAYKYGFMKRYMLLKLTTGFGVLVVTRVATALFRDDIRVFHAIGTFVIAGAFLPIIYWIFEDELQRVAREKRDLEEQMKKNIPFVEFGRNVSGIVHDFKNDFGLFSMFGQLMRINRGEILNDSQIDRYREYVQRFGDRIDRILTVTRAAQVTQRQEVDLVQLVDAVMYVFQTNLEFNRRINFSVVLPDEPVVIVTYPADVISILENIVRNGCEALVDHYGGDTGAISRAFLSVTLEDGETPSISVVDNGPGIPLCERCPGKDCMTCGVFEVGKTTKTKGTGLGMVTVRNAAARIGATIRVQSSPGFGVHIDVAFRGVKTLTSEFLRKYIDT